MTRWLLPLLVILAATYDMRERRIPNWLTTAGVAAGVVLHWKAALLGLGLALLVMMVPFFMRAVGAGDVKLMTAVGALAGPKGFLFIAVFSAVAGGVMALYLTWFRPEVKKKPMAVSVAVGTVMALVVQRLWLP